MKVYLIDRFDVQVFQDNKRLKIKSENGREYIEPQLDAQGFAQIQLVRKHELGYKFWWISAFVFWVIGLTGLFTPKYSKFFYSLDCTVRVSAMYNNVQIRLAKQYHNIKTNNISEVCVIGEGRAQIANGSYLFDSNVARRYKLYKLFSWFGRIIVIAVLIYAIIKSIINF